MNRKNIIVTQIILICALFALLDLYPRRDALVRPLLSLSVNPFSLHYSSLCNLTNVRSLHPLSCTASGFFPDVSVATRSNPCRWHVRATITSTEEDRPIDIRLLKPWGQFYNAHELGILQELEGCDSVESCGNRTVACKKDGLQDPSDALWLREYNHGGKFVVIFRLGFMSLLFYLVAILSDASIFFPHRPGSFAPSIAFSFGIIGCAALLYVLVVPRKWQFLLYGRGLYNSVAYVSAILIIAATLPGLTISVVRFSLFAIYFFGFVVEQLLCVVAGILHYLGALTLYQAEFTLFHLRLIYYRDLEEEAELDRRLLEMSRRFLSRVRRNVFLYRVPNALEQDGLQVIEGTLPYRLFDELVTDTIAQVDFDSLTNGGDDQDFGSDVAEGRSVSSSTPLLSRGTLPP